ncbi:hypothetical protein NPIL_15121 [Nephila pilipes]|uniref:Uncharacterized protein n=1 Tax=Nephila pilipes TaxID=299642 RepID=A0A8X6NDL7_NEPPI|nr:hypothetical protein NPIL_15121 [Nephila pilipes]
MFFDITHVRTRRCESTSLGGEYIFCAKIKMCHKHAMSSSVLDASIRIMNRYSDTETGAFDGLLMIVLRCHNFPMRMFLLPLGERDEYVLF